MDLLRKEIISDMLNAHIANSLNANLGVDMLWNRSMASISLMTPTAMLFRRITSFPMENAK